jgi:hypothetical protein
LNPFGTAFLNNRNVWTLSLALLDSDQDGFTNGQELGDPQGTGTPTPGVVPTNPGDPNSKPAAVAPAITTPPASQTVTAGASVTFNVVATGTAPLSYQWRKNGANISGANNTSFTISSTTTGDAGDYTVMVSNSAGSATSSAARLTVNAAPVAPVITTPPASQTVTAGASATFNVVATGTAPLSYQWKKNGANISGANNTSFTISSTTTGDAGDYTVMVSNSAGSATSSAASLTVNPAPVTLSVTVTKPANGASFIEPAEVTLEAAVTSAESVAKVQYFIGSESAGESSAAPYPVTLKGLMAGEYTLTAIVIDIRGAEATSSPVKFTVVKAPGNTGNTPPVVHIVSPEEGKTFRSPARIVLVAHATDADGSVAKVEFFAGDTLIGPAIRALHEEDDDDDDQDRHEHDGDRDRDGRDHDDGDDDDEEDEEAEARSVYYLDWNRVPPGQYALTAKATDNLGATSTSAPVNITVKPPKISSSRRRH